MSEPAERTLNHLIAWLGILLVATIVGFGAYYYHDRQSHPTRATPLLQATTRAEQAVWANPEDFGARMALAGAYFSGQRYAQSVEQYRAAVALDGKSLDAISGLARSLLEAGNPAGARAWFQQVLELAQDSEISLPQVGNAHFFLAKIAIGSQDYAEAIARATDALAYDRSDADALQLLGTAYVATGQWNEAIAVLTRATNFVPDFLEAYEQLAVAYLNKGMDAELRFAKGMQLYSSGKYDSAAKALEAVLATSPNLAAAHLGLGLVREKQEKRAAAVSEYEETLGLDANNFTAAASLVRLGKPWTGAAAAGLHAAPPTASTPTSTEEVQP